jgi:hypothetical protein
MHTVNARALACSPVTTPPPTAPPAPFDTGNQLLSEQPAQLTTVIIDTPAGQRLATTIRTPSATLTVFLLKKDAGTWSAALAAAAGGMSAAGLVVANGTTLGR